MDLLSDTLRQVFNNPQLPAVWHSLQAILLSMSRDQALQQLVEQPLIDWQAPDPDSEFLRLSFLWGMTGDKSFGIQAARLLLNNPKLAVDRIANFNALVWGTVITQGASSDEFADLLRQLSLPQLVQRLSKHAQTFMPKSSPLRSSKQPQRVALIAPQLCNAKHTPSVLVAAQTKLLVEQGMTVEIFSAQELCVADPLVFFGSTLEVKIQPLDTRYWQSVLPNGVRLTASDTRFSMESRWQMMIAAISAFSPDVILFCGFYSPLAGALYQHYPLLGLNVHALPLLQTVDVWLSADPQPAIAPQLFWGLDFAETQVHYYPYRLNRVERQSHLQRTDFGLSNHAVLWISVGTRLHDEISANWASDMLNLLERYPNVHWLLVGVNTLPAVLNGENSQRIHALGYRTDVIDVLDMADIYINPPRIGGGFSVAEAMGQGLPVVTFTNSDGGHKVGPQAVSTQQQYIHLLSQLTAHKAERQAFGEVLRERFNRDLDLAQAGDSLKAALETTCKVAAKRLQK